MFTRFKCMLSTLVILLFLIPHTQVSGPFTKIYAYVGMPQVHLPCIAYERLDTFANPQVESMWAHDNSSGYQMVIVQDKDGTKEKFRRLNLGDSTLHPNASLKNDLFYGRVSVSASRGLIINNVRLSDSGKFLCLTDTETNEKDKSEVELLVFNGTVSNNTLCVNDTSGISNTTDQGNGEDTDNPSSNTNCTIWMVLSAVFFGLIIAYVLGKVCPKLCAYCQRRVGDGTSPIAMPTAVEGTELPMGPPTAVMVKGVNGRVSDNGHHCTDGDYRGVNGNVAGEDNILTDDTQVKTAICHPPAL